MRIPIRTTIEESLLKEVKKQAIDQNCNVNDILENLIKRFIAWRDMNGNNAIDIDGNAALAAISSETRVALEKICSSYNLSVTTFLRSYIGDISKATAKVMLMANLSEKETKNPIDYSVTNTEVKK